MNTAQLTISKREWTRELSDGKLIYTPNDLKPGQQFKFVVYPIEPLNRQSLREWLTFNISKLQRELGDVNKEWNIKTEKNNSLSASNSFINAAGEKMAVGYNGIAIDNEYAFIVQMISINDFMLLLRYGACYDEVVNDTKSSFLSR